MTIADVVDRFHTTPFLFVGSGITRRYLGLPDWKGLLEYFAQEIRKDPFTYSAYENRARSMACPVGVMPKVAELMQYDYDEKWFRNEVPRHVDEETMEQIREGLSPFKAEVAEYVKRNSVVNPLYQKEIDKLSEISEKSIAGVVTTNYDTFLEDHFNGFGKYVGQSQLIFSAIQGIAEIYKIHGSLEIPSSIVINEADYLEFDAKSAYLAAKLMTIFMEYPIIFMGYSIKDRNIQNILKAIVNCLDSEQIIQLENRFVFIEYDPRAVEVEITPHTIMIDAKPLTMRKIILSDFLPLYAAIGNKRATLPVRILRKLKQELYAYVITNVPTAALRVASLEDKRVSDEELVLAIGKASQLGIRGLSGINGNDWYRNVVIGDLAFTADELLEHAYPVLIKQNSNRLPLNKYLALAVNKYPECEEMAEKLTLGEIIPHTIRKYRGCGEYHSVLEIWKMEGRKIERATRLISQLNENELNVDELEAVLMHLFRDRNVLECVSNTDRSFIRRLILIYDYLKWGKKAKELPD